MRVVDIDPFIKILEDNIEYFKRSGNGLGVHIYKGFIAALKELPIIRRGDTNE